MDAIECIKTRRSIRKYSDQPISHETVQEIAGVRHPFDDREQVRAFVP